MTTIQATIVSVVVYADQARVIRRGRVPLVSGEQTLVLPGLPEKLVQDSVRASGRGAGVKILGVEVATAFVTHPPEDKTAELQQQLEALQDADQALADDEAACAARAGLIKTLSESSGRSLAKSLAYGNASFDRVQALADQLDREMNAVHARQREIAQQRREQKREIDAAQARLSQLQNAQTNRRREVRVVVQSPGETELELDITYVVQSALWEPLYDLRLDGASVVLSYLASVCQRSGEDWPAVELCLSTARPAVRAEIPELDPWYLDVERPFAPEAFRAAPTGAAMPMAAAPVPAKMLEAVPEAQMATASVETSGAAVSYRVARPVAVPSDGSPHKTTLTVLDLAARLDYVTAPKLAEEAYVRAKIKNTSPFILLPGKANIFHGADFVGATELETIAPNEEFEVHLGVDDRIKVERELVHRTVDKALIGNTRRTLFGFKITLTNLLNTAAKITLLDQLPVARHEEIKVKLREALPKPTEQDDLNILTWELELRPQEKREVTFEFSVEHPRDMRLAGLRE